MKESKLIEDLKPNLATDIAMHDSNDLQSESLVADSLFLKGDDEATNTLLARSAHQFVENTSFDEEYLLGPIFKSKSSKTTDETVPAAQQPISNQTIVHDSAPIKHMYVANAPTEPASHVHTPPKTPEVEMSNGVPLGANTCATSETRNAVDTLVGADMSSCQLSTDQQPFKQPDMSNGGSQAVVWMNQPIELEGPKTFSKSMGGLSLAHSILTKKVKSEEDENKSTK